MNPNGIRVLRVELGFLGMSILPENQGDASKKTEQQWREQLTPEQFQVTRKKGTERAFTGKYWDEKAEGMFCCICCGLPLFESESKFDSGTGWPSFFRPADKANVSTLKERAFLLGSRTEVLCSRCDAHLGHVFPDGPEPTGLRYCINSAALNLNKKPTAKE